MAGRGRKGQHNRKSGGFACGTVLIFTVLTLGVAAYSMILLPSLALHGTTIDPHEHGHGILHPFFHRDQHSETPSRSEMELKARVESLAEHVEGATKEMEKVMGLLQGRSREPIGPSVHPLPVSYEQPPSPHSSPLVSVEPQHITGASIPENKVMPTQGESVSQNRHLKEPSIRNPILQMSEAEFRSTPVDQMLDMYATGQCPKDFGKELVDRWRNTATPCCKGSGEGSSSLTCHLIKQTGHHGSGDQLLLGKNVRLNFKDLVANNGKLPKSYFTDYVKSRHNQQYSKLPWSKGTLAGTCSVDPKEGWKREYFPGWNENWFRAFDTLSEEPQCDIWIEEPTLIVERDTFANFFHNSEDFFNTFLALGILRWPLKDLQVLLTDIYPDGPFWPMWSKIFFGGKKPMMAWDIAQQWGSKNVCFRQIAVAILGSAAPITVASRDTSCRGTNLVRAYSDFVVRGLGLHKVNEGRPLNHVNVTYVARRASSEWPEKRFCNSETSYFDCSQLKHLATRKLGRMIRNDPAVVSALKGLERQSFPNGAKVHFRDVDFNLLSFEDQIAIDATSDVMIGPHGAGLMHNIFMRDRGSLLELFVDGSSANRHFHNLAFWAGHSYQGQVSSNPINTDQLKNTVQSIIGKLDLTSR